MSKFNKIFEARKTDAAEIDESDNQKTPVKKKSVDRKNAGEIKAEIQKDSPPAESSPQPNVRKTAKRGRPTAKRSDPDFVGLTTYVRRDTHTRAKIELLREGKGRELSHLVEDLISNWLNSK